MVAVAVMAGLGGAEKHTVVVGRFDQVEAVVAAPDRAGGEEVAVEEAGLYADYSGSLAHSATVELH